MLVALLLSACSVAQGGERDGDPYARGVMALADGKPRLARIEFLNAIKARPDDPAVRVMQARTYLLLGDGIAAQAELERAVQLGTPRSAVAHLIGEALQLQGLNREALAALDGAEAGRDAYVERVRGRALMALGEMGEAGAALERALASAPADPRTLVEAARYHRATGDIAAAIAAADRALAAAPRDVPAITLRGELTRLQYGLAAALPWFDRALAVDPNDVTALLERAATLGELGRMNDMLADTRKALALSPRQPMAYYLQAVLAARAHDYALARRLLVKTGGALDELPAAMLLDGGLAYQAGNYERAIERLGRLVAMQPRNVKARRLLGAAQWRGGDSAGAAAALRPLVEGGSADPYALTLYGRALAELGDADAGFFLARAAVPFAEAQPGSWNALDVGNASQGAAGDARIIRSLLAEGQAGEALDRARALQAANSGAPGAHLLVGDVLAMMGRFAEAAEAYRRAANLAFTEPTALRLVDALERAGQAEAAHDVLTLFVTQNPRSLDAARLAADRHFAAGRWADAAALYERLRARIGDGDAALLNNLALATAANGDMAEALPIAQRAWALDRRNPATANSLGWLLVKSGEDVPRGMVLLQQSARGAPRPEAIRARLAAARAAALSEGSPNRG